MALGSLQRLINYQGRLADASALPVKVVVSPLDNEIGGTAFVATKVNNITADGFDVTFESKTGASSSGSAAFTYQAFGQ